MAESEVEKELKVLEKELDNFITIKEKIEKSFCKSKEPNTNEEREFQLQVLEYQRNYDTLNSVLTVVIGIGFSLAVAITAISYTSIGESLRISLTYISLSAIAVSAFSTVLLVYFHKTVFPKLLEEIRTKFLKNRTTESSKE